MQWYDPSWLDASKYKPESFVDVMLTDGKLCGVGSWSMTGGWFVKWTQQGEFGEVTHWIELPDLPGGEQDET